VDVKKRTHFTRYVVLHTYELRQGWKRFKAEAAQLWLYWRFRAKYSVGRVWGKKDKGDFEPLTEEQYAVLSKAAPAQHGKTVSSLFDPRNDHLFTAEAAHKALAHLKPLSREEVAARNERLIQHVGTHPSFAFEAVCETFAHLKTLETKMTPERLAAIRAQADAYLRDAQREENSDATRADCAFDAVYMFCRCIMAGQDEGLQHPHVGVLAVAAERLGWSPAQMGPALTYIEYRDSDERLARPRGTALTQSTRETLVRLAETLKAAST
jgi:hypothetical protein